MEDKNLKELLFLAVESMGVAISLIDTEGNLLYYNKQAEQILDRKPEYISKDIHIRHKKASNTKLNRMLEAFRKGRTEPFYYKATPSEKTIFVTLSPILKNNQFIGCAQSVQLKDDIEPFY
ncbi:PAS domain-containing protein [Chloroflexota bacterium]